jgi:hypothetical protein
MPTARASRVASPLLTDRMRAQWATLALASSLVGCSDLAWTKSFERAATGQCLPDDDLLYGPARDCIADSMCPCGSFCHQAHHVCRFSCKVPPADPSQRCPTGMLCNSDGRCVTP